MKHTFFLSCAIVLACSAFGQHYQYNKPKIPFYTGQRLQYATSSAQTAAQQQPSQQHSFIVQTTGPHARTYELDLTKSNQIYIAGLTQQQNQPNYAVPLQTPIQSQQQILQQQPQYAAQLSGFTGSPSVGAAYRPSVTLPAAQLTTSGNFAPANQQLQPLGFVHTTPSLTYNPSSNGAVAAVYQSQAVAPQQTAAHAQASSGQHSAGVRTGNYYAQSQASQLDHYNYKQGQIGDARDFQRQITTCQPNGQCQRQNLAPGQVESTHQQNIANLRAHTTPVHDSCKQFVAERAAKEAAYAGGSYQRGGAAAHPNSLPRGTELNAKGQIRPQNRRYYPYTETVQQRDPYN